MRTVLVIGALALSLAWVPLALKFLQAWRHRRNPVSLAICVTVIQFIYANIVFAFAMTGEATWRFYAVATRLFELTVIVNFYIAFRWSDMKFSGARRSDPSPERNEPGASTGS